MTDPGGAKASAPAPADPAAQLERLVSLTMPFGKYKGRLVADLPSAYLDWFARKGFPKGEIGRLLALMHEIDQGGVRAVLNPLRGATSKNTVKSASGAR